MDLNNETLNSKIEVCKESTRKNQKPHGLCLLKRHIFPLKANAFTCLLSLPILLDALLSEGRILQAKHHADENVCIQPKKQHFVEVKAKVAKHQVW